MGNQETERVLCRHQILKVVKALGRSLNNQHSSSTLLVAFTRAAQPLAGFAVLLRGIESCGRPLSWGLLFYREAWEQ